jgi:hypothetical protein
MKKGLVKKVLDKLKQPCYNVYIINRSKGDLMRTVLVQDSEGNDVLLTLDKDGNIVADFDIVQDTDTQDNEDN